MYELSDEERKWAKECWQKLDEKLKVVSKRSRGKFPFWTADGMHNNMQENSINCWTNGFWPGLNWLMYAGTGNEEYRETAETGETLLDMALEHRL